MQKKLSAINVVLSLAGILFVFFFPRMGLIPFPFGYAVIVLLVVWLLLKASKEGFGDVGFAFSRCSRKAVFVGILSGTVLFLFLNNLLFPLIKVFVRLPKPDLKDFASLRHHPGSYLFVLCMGWLVGGVYEEIVFHGYIFTRLEKMISGRFSLPVCFLLTNLIFAVYHIQLGPTGMLNAFLAGCAYLALMLGFKRNMWYAVFAHAAFDTIGLTFIYLGYW